MSRNSKKIKPQKQSDYDPDVSPNPSETPNEGPIKPEQPQAPPAPKKNVFGLSFVVPTGRVNLPSGGLYYPESSPLYGRDSLVVKHMTAKDEDTLSSIISSPEETTFDRLIDGILEDENVKSSMLLEEDKLAVLLHARSTGYGNNYTTSVFCPNCSKETEHTFDLTKVSFKQPPEESTYNPHTNVFTFTTPVSQIEVELLNLTEKDELDLLKEQEKKKKYNIEFNYLLTFLNKVIVSANGVSDPEMISKLVDVLPAADAKSIKEFFNFCRPQISTLQTTECSVCSTQSELEAPLSWAMFRINS